MKSLSHMPYVVFTLFAVTACYASTSAASPTEHRILAGQSVYPSRGSFGCYSLEELNRASALKAQGGGQQLFAYVRANHCGIFEGNETADVIRIEKSGGYDALVVTMPDQPSAPREVWIKSTDVSVGHYL